MQPARLWVGTAGAQLGVRADDLGAVPIRALMACHLHVDWAALNDARVNAWGGAIALVLERV